MVSSTHKIFGILCAVVDRWCVGGSLVAAANVYLLVRAMEAGESAWRALLRPNMLYTLLRTVWLAFSVTLLSMFIAVPLAWLTVRSDLPGRRFGQLLRLYRWCCRVMSVPIS